MFLIHVFLTTNQQKLACKIVKLKLHMHCACLWMPLRSRDHLNGKLNPEHTQTESIINIQRAQNLKVFWRNDICTCRLMYVLYSHVNILRWKQNRCIDILFVKMDTYILIDVKHLNMVFFLGSLDASNMSDIGKNWSIYVTAYLYLLLCYVWNSFIVLTLKVRIR